MTLFLITVFVFALLWILAFAGLADAVKALSGFYRARRAPKHAAPVSFSPDWRCRQG